MGLFNLGSATVDVRADLNPLEKGLAQGQRSTERATMAMGNAFGALQSRVVALGAAIGSGALLRSFDNIISKLDNIGKTADKIGVSTTALQEWRLAATDAGASAGTLDTSLQRLSRRAAEARDTGQGVTNILKGLGIALFDSAGRAKNTEQLFREVADAMSRMKNRTDQLRVAVALFDTEGASLVNMMRNGSAAIDANVQKFRDWNSIISEDSIRAAESLRSEIDTLSTALGSTLITAVGNAAIAINQLFGIGAQNELNIVNRQIGQLEESLNRLSTGNRDALDFLFGVPDERGIIEGNLKALRARRDALSAGMGSGNDGIIQPTGDMITQFQSASSAAGKSASDAKQKIDDFLVSLREQVTTLRQELSLAGASASASATLTAAFDKQAVVRKMILLQQQEGVELSADQIRDARAYADEVERLTIAIHQQSEAAESARQASEDTARKQKELADSIRGVSDQLVAAIGNATSFKDALRQVLIVLTQVVLQGALGRGPLGNVGNQIFGVAEDGILGAIFGAGGAAAGGSPASMLAAGLIPVAKGGVYSNGSIQRFADGGVVDQPSMFPTRDGMGLMSEAGAEAIMPLARDQRGRLGVRLGGAARPEIRQNVILVDDRKDIGRFLASPEGEEILLLTLRRNGVQVT